MKVAIVHNSLWFTRTKVEISASFSFLHRTVFVISDCEKVEILCFFKSRDFVLAIRSQICTCMSHFLGCTTVMILQSYKLRFHACINVMIWKVENSSLNVAIAYNSWFRARTNVPLVWSYSFCAYIVLAMSSSCGRPDFVLVWIWKFHTCIKVVILRL